MLFECQATYLNSTFATVEAPSRHQAARDFQRRHGRWPEMVGCHQVVGRCEECGYVIFEDEPSHTDEAGRVHNRCPEN